LLCDGDYRKANSLTRNHRVAKTSNVSAPNCGSSSEVAVKEMHDIGIDAVLLDIFNKILK
jgi:3-isopropylmalate dehydratase small subunit